MDLSLDGQLNLIEVLREALKENDKPQYDAKLFYFSKNLTYYYCGSCKVTVDGVEQSIDVENDVARVIAKSSVQHFFQQKQILMVLDKNNGQSFALIFGSEEECRKVYIPLIKAGVNEDRILSLSDMKALRNNLKSLYKAKLEAEEIIKAFDDFGASSKENSVIEIDDDEGPSDAKKFKFDPNRPQLYDITPQRPKISGYLAGPSAAVHQPVSPILSWQKKPAVVHINNASTSIITVVPKNLPKAQPKPRGRPPKILFRSNQSPAAINPLCHIKPNPLPTPPVFLQPGYRLPTTAPMPLMNQQTVKVVRHPYYQIIESDTGGLVIKKLTVFDEKNPKLCHEYVWIEGARCFKCWGCQHNNLYRGTARVRKSATGEELVEVTSQGFQCKLRPYDRLKAMVKRVFREPDYEITGEGAKKILTITDTQNGNKEYTYVWNVTYSRFICQVCYESHRQVSTNARLHQNDKGEEYIVCGNFNHVCQGGGGSRKPAEKSIESTDFEFTTSPDGVPAIQIYTSKSKRRFYTFRKLVPTAIHYCQACFELNDNSSTHVPKLELRQRESGEFFVTMMGPPHKCEPTTRDDSDLIIEAPNFFFYRDKVTPDLLYVLITFPDGRHFSYTFHPSDNLFFCNGCKEDKSERCSAEYCKNSDGTEYLRLNHREHSCQPYSLESIQSRVDRIEKVDLDLEIAIASVQPLLDSNNYTMNDNDIIELD